MSAVTLETLRADFEATLPVGLADGMMVDDYAAKYDDLCSHPTSTCFKAQLYLIAREHGVNAAMLYRLSDGAIDPREGGAA